MIGDNLIKEYKEYNNPHFGVMASGISGHLLANPTRGLFGGGWTGSAASNIIQYITIATTGNSIDFGDLSLARLNATGTQDNTRAVWCGGQIPSWTYREEMDYVTILTTGNATDFGNLVTRNSTSGGMSHGGRGCVAGGYYPASGLNVIQYHTIQSPSNSTDFGDLTVARWITTGVNDASGRGCIAGGY